MCNSIKSKNMISEIRKIMNARNIIEVVKKVDTKYYLKLMYISKTFKRSVEINCIDKIRNNIQSILTHCKKTKRRYNYNHIKPNQLKYYVTVINNTKYTNFLLINYIKCHYMKRNAQNYHILDIVLKISYEAYQLYTYMQSHVNININTLMSIDIFQLISILSKNNISWRYQKYDYIISKFELNFDTMNLKYIDNIFIIYKILKRLYLESNDIFKVPIDTISRNIYKLKIDKNEITKVFLSDKFVYFNNSYDDINSENSISLDDVKKKLRL